MEDSVRYPILYTKGQKTMTKIYKRIHMPKPLYEEIERFVSKHDSPYKTVGELCREAGRMLIEHYKLREKYV
jgi:metal-responsive CopG/Arc/MetJ family transcriptional regulator